MNEQQQERQLARIPRIIETIDGLEARKPDDKRLAGLKKELDRRMAECHAFQLSDRGAGFVDRLNAALDAIKTD